MHMAGDASSYTVDRPPANHEQPPRRGGFASEWMDPEPEDRAAHVRREPSGPGQAAAEACSREELTWFG